MTIWSRFRLRDEPGAPRIGRHGPCDRRLRRDRPADARGCGRRGDRSSRPGRGPGAQQAGVHGPEPVPALHRDVPRRRRVHPVGRCARRRALGRGRHGHVRRHGQAVAGAPLRAARPSPLSPPATPTPGTSGYPWPPTCSATPRPCFRCSCSNSSSSRRSRCSRSTSGAIAAAAGVSLLVPLRNPLVVAIIAGVATSVAWLESARRRPRRSRGARPRRGAGDPDRVRHRPDGPAGALARRRPQGGPPRHRDQGGADARRRSPRGALRARASRSTRC